MFGRGAETINNISAAKKLEPFWCQWYFQSVYFALRERPVWRCIIWNCSFLFTTYVGTNRVVLLYSSSCLFCCCSTRPLHVLNEIKSKRFWYMQENTVCSLSDRRFNTKHCDHAEWRISKQRAEKKVFRIRAYFYVRWLWPPLPEAPICMAQ